MINYKAGDFLIKIKNAALSLKGGSLKNKVVVYKNSKLINKIAEVLKELNVLDEIKKEDKNIIVHLKVKSKEPILENIKLISKPGLRIYIDIDEILKRKDTYSSLIISTSKGVLSEKKAKKLNIGGELIAEVW